MTRIARAFVAVVPPPRVLAGIESLAESVNSVNSVSPPDGGLRWAPASQWHLTLQFLGRLDGPDSFAESLGESLRRIAPFPLQLGGGGAFPSAGRGSVLWVGVVAGGAELTRLARAVAAVSGIEEEHPFRPHLTVARCSSTRDLRTAVDVIDRAAASAPFLVDEVILFESDTRPDGAVHTGRARVALMRP